MRCDRSARFQPDTNEMSTAAARNVANIVAADLLKTTKAPEGALFYWSE